MGNQEELIERDLRLCRNRIDKLGRVYFRNHPFSGLKCFAYEVEEVLQDTKTVSVLLRSDEP